MWMSCDHTHTNKNRRANTAKAGGTGGVCVSAFFGAPFSKSPLDLFPFYMHEACQTQNPASAGIRPTQCSIFTQNMCHSSSSCLKNIHKRNGAAIHVSQKVRFGHTSMGQVIVHPVGIKDPAIKKTVLPRNHAARCGAGIGE